jgi:predicted RNA-binding protein (virulence factor B family)
MTYTNEELEILFSQGNSKINKSVKLSEADRKANVKIFCKEPYAQDLYDRYFGSDAGRQLPTASKDIPVGEIRTVSLKKIDFAMSMVEMEDVSSMTSIFVPFREFSQEPSLSLLNEDKDRKYKVMIYKSNMSEILGSEKKCAALTLREDVEYFTKNNKWFYVKVVELIKGGYLAIYKNQIKCFLPGSHAAANVIRDFSEYLHKEIPVMVENYDSVNNLFIVSYKKYIKETLPQKVSDLSFSQKYTGTLTNNPYDFGIFVEFQNYYTGLIHKSDFENDAAFKEFSKGLRSGNQLDFWVKDVVQKKGEYRIILTTNPDSIDPVKKSWQSLKDGIENQILNYSYSKGSMTITLPDEQTISVSVSATVMQDHKVDGRVLIQKVDVIKQNLGFEVLLD